jgi:hypothetical protein
MPTGLIKPKAGNATIEVHKKPAINESNLLTKGSPTESSNQAFNEEGQSNCIA